MAGAQTKKSIYQQTVEHIMTRDTVTLRADGTIHDALTMMSENRVTALPVVDRNNHCIGILSMTDLIDLTRDIEHDLNEIEGKDFSRGRLMLESLAQSMGNEKVQTFMSESVTTISPATRIGKATKLMLRNGIHHLPVIDTKEQLVGIVSTMDILSEFADNAPD